MSQVFTNKCLIHYTVRQSALSPKFADVICPHGMSTIIGKHHLNKQTNKATEQRSLIIRMNDSTGPDPMMSATFPHTSLWEGTEVGAGTT